MLKPSSGKPPQRQDSKLKDVGANVVNYPQVTHDILDQHLAQAIVKDVGLNYNSQESAVTNYLNQNKIRGASPIQQSPKSTSSEDVVTSMAVRLSKIEKLCNAQKLELKEKSQKIIELQDKISFLEKTQSKESLKAEFDRCLEENKQLKSKIEDMEKFLLDYGIKWVGNQPEQDAHQKIKQIMKDVSQQKPMFNYKLPQEISIEAIIRRVDELNYIMEKEGASEVAKNAQGMHYIKKMDPLPIGFYKNGIAMKGFKFFAYGSNDAYLILADILEGFFPYQVVKFIKKKIIYKLKKQYPNGTLLKVIDKTDEIYDSEKLMDQKQCNVLNIDEKNLKPQSKEEFLNKLPKQIIKNGKVIPIRSAIAEKFDSPNTEIPKNLQIDSRLDQDGSIIILTSAQKQLDQGMDYDQDLICTLKFRTESGKFTLIALMFSTETIQQMYEQVEKFKENKDKKIEILLNFPRTIFDPNSKQCLLDAGLHPNAQLFFKLI